MKRIKFFVLVILVLSLFQFNLYSLITSRVEGTVIDKDTGLKIVGASITLYCSDTDLRHFFNWKTQTDNNGYFRFEIEEITGTFYVQCSKYGYISFLPEYYRRNIKQEYVEEVFHLFNLQEGQIKHLKIALEKGGTLTCDFFVKDSSGTSVLKDAGVFLCRLRDLNDNHLVETNNFNVKYVKLDENGKIRIDGIEPSNKYYISLIPNGYYKQTIENISIVKNETRNISYTLDCTDKATVEGYLTINDQLVYSGSASIKNPEKDKFGKYSFCTYKLRNEKFYTLKGIPPGKYRLSAGGVIKGNIIKDKEISIELKAGETKVFNFDL
jgi:hypothetical protein